METLTRAWAAEFGPQGVRVNAISPGVVQTAAPGVEYPGEVMMKGTPAGRLGNPEAIGYAAVYLASDEARSSTEACWTWMAAAPRRPSSPGSARTITATGAGGGSAPW
jgi:NAD(P)-dependent dehydrogenase (short-subunit alcohol dehydrogenase family)